MFSNPQLVRPDRTAGQPIGHLAGFRGVLQVDGYEGYKALARRGEVRLASSWSHVRRGFYELAGDKAPIATEALARIAARYRIESEIRGRPAEERRARRAAGRWRMRWSVGCGRRLPWWALRAGSRMRSGAHSPAGLG